MIELILKRYGLLEPNWVATLGAESAVKIKVEELKIQGAEQTVIS